MENKIVSVKDSALAFIIGFLLCQTTAFVFMLVGITICRVLKFDVSSFEMFLNTSYGYLLSVIVLNATIIGIFVYFNKGKQNKIIEKPKANKILIYFLLAVASFFALSPIINCVDSLISKLNIELNVIPYELTPLNMFVSVFSLAIIPAICEELLFRGLIFKGLKSGGKAFSIIISAVMFSLFHCAIEQTIYPLLIGLMLGVIMYYENNILYCITVHLTNNLLSLIISYFNISLSFNHFTFYLLAVVLAIIFLAVVLFFTFKNNKNTKLNYNKQDYVYLNISLIIMILIWFAINISR